MPNGPYEGVSNPPDGGNVSTVAPPPAGNQNVAARDQWLATAGGGSPKPAAPAIGSAGTQQQPAATPGLPQQQQPAPKPATAPVVTSTKRGGLLGVMDSVTDALVGKTRPEVGTDADGNAYIKQHTMTRGQQWMRIAGEAMRGAAAGLAAGRGAGNMGKAAQAGIEAGDKSRQQEYSDVQQKVLDQANNQMLRMKLAEETWRQSRLKVEATQQDVKFWGEQQDRIEKAGGVFLGHAAHPGDISAIQTANPDVMKDLVKNPTSLEFIPQVDNSDVTTGFAVYKVPEKYGQEWMPAGTPFRTYDNIKHEYVNNLTTKPTIRSEIDAYNTAAGNAAAKFSADQAEEQLKIANKEKAEQETTASKEELPGKKDLTQAQIGEAKASAGEKGAQASLAEQKAKQVKAGMITDDGTPNPRFEAMAQALYNGDILPEDLKREAKGAQLDPNMVLGRAIEIGQAAGKPFSESIIKDEHKFSSSPKTQAALDGIDRILGAPGAPGYMDQMLNLSKQAGLIDSNLPGAGLANDVMLWTQRNMGDNAAKNLNTSIAETRRSIAGLIGNPLLGGSDTDKKLQQADEMLGQRPTVANLQGAANVLEQALRTQRNSLVQNNRFLLRRYGTTGVGPAAAAQPTAGPATARPAPPRPPSVPATAHWDWNANNGKGMWIP
jgi:hypothetical protein